MAKANFTPIKSNAVHIPHPYTSQFKWPSRGKLKWLGGNLSLVCPVEEEVMDDCGNVFFMSLDQVLSHIDDFEGYRRDTSIKANIIDRCFCAYKYGQLTALEKHIFEKFVIENIGSIESVEAAKTLMLSKFGVVKS